MTSFLQKSRSRLLGALALALCACPTVWAEGRAVEKDDAVNAALFGAMKDGKIDVKFIPQGPHKANVIVKNLTDKPMNLRLPAAFAGVPVLAQGMMGGGMGGMGGGGMGGMGGGMGGGGGQAMGGGMGGGGMGGMGGGMGGGGMGGGFMRIAPEKVRKMAVNTVCLEHGKPDPTPKMAYKIVPLEDFTEDGSVRAICEALGRGQVAQNTAQAATWHLTDEMSWNELAKKNRVESVYTGTIKFFSPLELKAAMAVVSEAKRIASESEDDKYAAETSEG